VWCQITDRGPGFRHRAGRPRSTDRLGPGHGLWLVRQLCAQVDVESGPHGTEVLLRYPLSGRR
jgi:anti-sigma regulatory factor (Ser/Thr protein kinase)